ncbi:MAG: L,D-transpeptidase [Caldilinea sp.]|nr:L,D-transpeptidase [Caldilinea sp.]MDW8442551.1 L,D-transpeptidase [Caldilineaceae bacterium]
MSFRKFAGLRQSVHMRHFFRCALALALLIIGIDGAGEVVRADERAAAPSPHSSSAFAPASSLSLFPITANLPRPAEKPPLPFTEPLVGPFIKRAPMSDIERRTTAFLPTEEFLARLTPIEPPDEDRWIRVDLSEQVTIVYENGKAIRGFVISSGLPRTPTVQGEFRIRMKVRSQTMSGGSGASYYYLPNVQWVQYFYGEYAFHGTYWHSDFGRPKSRGCINMTNADAKWLFDWAGPVWDGKTAWFRSTPDNPGTLVIVHE